MFILISPLDSNPCCCYLYMVERLFRDLSDSMAQGSLLVTINLRKLQLVLTRLTGLTGLLVRLLPLFLGQHDYQLYCALLACST
jgi:hypothetical protein